MARKRRKGKRRHKGGQVPLEILEKRLRKLTKVVDERGGSIPGE